MDLFAIDKDLSLIGLVDAAEAFDQGRLPRPVVAEERKYFVTFQREAHAVQGQGCPEALGKVPYLEDGPPFSSLGLLCAARSPCLMPPWPGVYGSVARACA